MKKVLILSLFALSFMQMNAQVINSSSESMANGVQNTIVLELPSADKKMAEKEWRAYMKPYGTLKKVKRSKEFIQESARISAISTDAATVYSRVDDVGAGSRVLLWIDLGNGEYVSPSDHEDMYAGAEEFLKEFEFVVRKAKVAQDVDDLEDQLRGLEKSLKKLEKENTKLHDTIEKAKATIAQAEEDIITNVTEQEESKVQIAQQIERVNETKEKYRTMKREDN